jgi:ubiquinone/menaquinone biosynthesis C-methylase UbiE
LQFDEAAARRMEAVYVTPDVVAQRDEVLQALALQPGERVLDIGSGPGLLARAMAQAVGPTGHVRGIDISESMLALAQARCADQPNVDFQPGDATRLPFDDASFDVAVSTQVYEYVADVDAALAELFRVLGPGGRAAVLDTDWASIVWHATDTARMERVLAAWDEHAADPHLPRTLGPRLRRAGFQVQRRAVVPLFNPDGDPETYSFRAIPLIAAFVVGRRGITQQEADAWVADLQVTAERGAYFFSLNRYLFVASKPGAGESP